MHGLTTCGRARPLPVTLRMQGTDHESGGNHLESVMMRPSVGRITLMRPTPASESDGNLTEIV